MDIKQNLHLSQRIAIMTPQLQQAIRLLHMSQVDLRNAIQKELLENPLLEDSEYSSSDETIDRNSDDKDHFNSIHWGRKNLCVSDNIEDHSHYVSELPYHLTDTKNNLNWEQVLVKKESLYDHILKQYTCVKLEGKEKKLVEAILVNLDERGYLVMDDLSSHQILTHISKKVGIEIENAKEILRMLQHIEPVGMCARTLQECLLIQAKYHNMDPLIIQILSYHLDKLKKRDYNEIAQVFKVPLRDIHHLARAIAKLNPSPGAIYFRDQIDQTSYLMPDVYVFKSGNSYRIMTNDDGLPKLKVRTYYRQAMNTKAKKYIDNKLNHAWWFVRSIERRRQTIVQVTECIANKQREFLEKGIEYLCPMTLKNIAESLDMHESTVSRVISNKYVHTDQGIFPLKYFFNTGIERSGTTAISSEIVKQYIKRIIDHEDPNDPYHDRHLVEILKEKYAIQISRRTIAKYREAIGISKFSERKKSIL